MNLSLKILQNIMILAFGVSSLMHASSSSSSSIAQGLVRAASIAGHRHHTQLSAARAIAQANWQSAAAQKMPISASEIAEAHLRAIWPSASSSSNNYAQASLPSTDRLSSASATASTALLAGYATQHPAPSEMFSASQGLGVSLPSSSSSNSSSSGSAQPVQASAPDKKARPKGIQPDLNRLASYNEEEACKKYKEYKKEAKKYCKGYKDSAKPGVQLYMCTYTTDCGHKGKRRDGVCEHIVLHHLLKEKGLFACLKCARFYGTKRLRDLHSNKFHVSQESSSSSNSSSSGSAQLVQASAPDKKARPKGIQPDPNRLASYDEEEACKKYEEYKEKAKEYCKDYQDSAKPGVQFSMCTYENCGHKGKRGNQFLEHIVLHHLLKEKGLFACQKCARFYGTKRSRDQHSNNKCRLSQESSSSSCGSAEASVPDISTNNEASALVASLLPIESAERPTLGQAQSSRKRKDSSSHKQPSSKKQKIDQQEIQKQAQNFPSSSSSSSAAAAAILLADSASSSSSSSSNYTEAPMPSTDGLSLASATAATALLAGYAIPQAAPSAQQELDPLAVFLETDLSDSNSSTSSNNLSSSGSAQPAQASAPDKKARAKRPQPDPNRLASYDEEEACKKYKEYEKEAKKYCKGYKDSAEPGMRFHLCTYENCGHTIPHKGQMVEHIVRHHLLKEKCLFACLKCARFYYTKSSRDKHINSSHLSQKSSSSSSSNSSSSGSAEASVPDISTNNEASALVASLLPAEPGEMPTVGQAQSSRKRKDSSLHKQPSSKKQKIDQEAIEKPAQNFPSSSSSSSSSNYAQAPMPSTDGLSSASATASTALLAGYASQHTSPQQELEALALLLGTSLPDSNSSTSAQEGALPTDSNESVAPTKDTVDDFDIGKFLQSDY